MMIDAKFILNRWINNVKNQQSYQYRQTMNIYRYVNIHRYIISHAQIVHHFMNICMTVHCINKEIEYIIGRFSKNMIE